MRIGTNSIVSNSANVICSKSMGLFALFQSRPHDGWAPVLLINIGEQAALHAVWNGRGERRRDADDRRSHPSRSWAQGQEALERGLDGARLIRTPRSPR